LCIFRTLFFVLFFLFSFLGVIFYLSILCCFNTILPSSDITSILSLVVLS
jgi:hypothetical protein